ncbi:MAG: hypothetical protein H9Q66_06680 [Spiroplasma ixodetis]|nr:hypothetical protein [Spiroplasma ixodetis]
MKTWIKTNLNKITLALALTGAISGVTGLTIGSLAHHKTNDLQYYLGHQYNVYWGGLEQLYGRTKQMMNTK